uniref:Uncharacterized protein n=1 Tax=Vannella robusta TaxID=1487602 RepID=A0A7S4M4X1_9EUKA|mmetsp:Transcript_1157/g.1436  ORF Transcript_1157/g.1436 Transcript_1157/m.1436 type:complete len:177 (+) Transcript_1157:259-789(+)
MSTSEAEDLLQSLEDLQEAYAKQLLVIGTQMSKLSRAMIKKGDLDNTVSDIKYSLRALPKLSVDADSVEEENLFLRQAIAKLKQEKEEHKASFHCLQKTGQSRSPVLKRHGTISSPKSEKFRRSTSNYRIPDALKPSRDENILIEQNTFQQHLKQLDQMTATTKETSELLTSSLES